MVDQGSEACMKPSNYGSLCGLVNNHYIDDVISRNKGCIHMNQFRKIFTIGITGSAGSGKSLVRKAFEDIGLRGFDADAVARKVVEPGQPAHKKLVELFGYGIRGKDGQLNRSLMREQMMADENLRRKMEAVLHPIIIETLFADMYNAEYPREPACAVEVPLLFELGLENRFSAVVAVTCHESELISRISLRDSVSQTSAKKMLSLQMNQEEKIQRADYVIHNTGQPEQIHEKVASLYAKIKKEFLTRRP